MAVMMLWFGGEWGWSYGFGDMRRFRCSGWLLGIPGFPIQPQGNLPSSTRILLS